MQLEISVYGVDQCEDTQRTRQHLSSLGIPYRYINLEKDSDADRKVKEWNNGRRLTPTVIVSGAGRTARLVEPSDEEMDRVLLEHGLQVA